MLHYEQILTRIGSFGIYQKLIVIFYTIPASFHSAWTYYALVYAGMVPKFACNQTVPEVSDSCLNNDTQKQCTESFVFDYGYIITGQTMASEWDLVCDNSFKLALIFTASQVGELVGCICVPYIMDNIGRRLTIIVMNLWFLATGVALYFAPTFISAIVIIFFRGMGLRLAWAVSWILSCELLGGEYRARLYLFSGIAWAVALCALSLVSWAIMFWRKIILMTTLLTLIFIPQLLLTLESPRWLVTKGKHEKAFALLTKMAKINGTTIQYEDYDAAVGLKPRHESETVADQQQYGVWSLLTHGRSLVLKTFILCALNVITFMVYTGLNYNMQNFGTNPYIAGAAMALVEIPACLVTPLSNRLGRVIYCSVALLIAGTFAVAGVLIPPSTANWASITAAVGAKFFITLSLNLHAMILAEVIPTVVRASGAGLSALASLLSTFTIPYIVHAAGSRGFETLPLTIFSIMAYLGSVLVLFLPETAHEPMVDTFEQERRYPVTFGNVLANLRMRINDQ